MFAIQVDILVEEITQIPQAHNVLNEIDGVASPMGLRRLRGEKTREFKDHMTNVCSVNTREPERVDIAAGLETRIPHKFVVFENLSYATHVVSVRCLGTRRLVIDVYDQSIVPFQKTTYTYDLLNRGKYPFMDDLVAAVTVDIPELRAYVWPFLQSRDNSLLPEHLSVCANRFSASAAWPGKDQYFWADYSGIIPDSIKITHDLPEDVTLAQQPDAVTVLSSGDPGYYFIDYARGIFVSGGQWGMYQANAVYEFAEPIFYMPATPGASIIEVGNKDVLHRALHWSHPTFDSLSGLVNDVPRSKVNEHMGTILDGDVIAQRISTPSFNRWLADGNLVYHNRNRFKL